MRRSDDFAFYTESGKIVLPENIEVDRIRNENAKVTKRIQKALEKEAWSYFGKIEKKYPKVKPNLFPEGWDK